MSRNQWINIGVGVGVVFVAAFLTQAQGATPPTKQPNPAQQPAPAQTPTPGHTIFDYKAELNLSDKQEDDIRALLADLNKEVRLGNAKLTIVNSELEELVKTEGDVEQIRKKVKEAFDLQANVKFDDIVATRKINRVLSPEQLKRWRSIQAAARGK
jgi:hypothetical protein